MKGGVSDNPAFADLSFPHFKLRLDQRQDGNIVPKKGKKRRQEEFQGDEGGVYDRKIKGFGNLLPCKVPGVCPFQNNYPWILAEFPVKLAVADINSIDFISMVLQKTVGKTAS